MPTRTKTWTHKGQTKNETSRRWATWSPLYSNSEGWFRWFNGEGWRRVSGPEEDATRC